MKKNKNVLAKIGELEDCILDYYSFKNTLAKVGKLDNLIEEYYFHAVELPNERRYETRMECIQKDWGQKDLTDKANAIFYHLLDKMDYDCEDNQELSEYMLRATDREAAIYWKKWLMDLMDGNG
jgi:hypothetical protein